VASSLSPVGPGHDHIGLPSAAFRTDKPLAPIEDTGVGAVPSSHLGGIGLNLVAAILVPDDQPQTVAAAAFPSVIGGPVHFIGPR
jgi:hypothetical protein